MRVYDGRPAGEMVLAAGSLEEDSPADHLTLEVGTRKRLYPIPYT